MKILILSTSLLTNRLLSKSLLSELSEQAEVTVWAANKPLFMPENCHYEAFPQIKNNRERVNVIRKINDTAWVKKMNLASVISQKRFDNSLSKPSLKNKLINFLGGMVALFGLHHVMESFVKRLVLSQNRSEEGRERLKALQPDAIIVCNPFWIHESALAIEATKLGIKLLAIVPSWDNITTKSRLTFNADAYFVWSKIRALELARIYPDTKGKPIYEYGTPQYECFFDTEFEWSKEKFCTYYKLDPAKKIILYATGSPNFLKTEYDGAEQFANVFMNDPSFEGAQLLIRPHPNKDNNELQYLHQPGENVFVQFTKAGGVSTFERNLDKENAALWINTFRHCDVLINLSSTVILDAIVFDKPVININFDPHDKKAYDAFIKEINSTWTHLKTIKDCAKIVQASDMEEVKKAVLHYLENPLDGLEERKEMFHQICLDPKQRLGEKLAKKLIEAVK